MTLRIHPTSGQDDPMLRTSRSSSSTCPASGSFTVSPPGSSGSMGFLRCWPGLGLAFRNRPPDPIEFDLVDNAASARIKKAIEAYNAASKLRPQPRPGIIVPPVRPPRGPGQGQFDEAPETGKTPLVVEPIGTRSRGSTGTTRPVRKPSPLGG